VHGDAEIEAIDLPAGGGHVGDDGEGGLVLGFVDRHEFFDDAFVFFFVLNAEDGFVGRDEVGVFLGASAVFEGVAGGFGFAGIGYWAFGFGAVFTGDLSAIFFGHLVPFPAVEIRKASVVEAFVARVFRAGFTLA
jgi:hypothetical protein